MDTEATSKNIRTDEDQKLFSEVVTTLYKNSPIAFIASLINSVALVIILRNSVSPSTLVSWLTCIFLITLARHIHIRRFLVSKHGTRDIKVLERAFITGVAFSGLAWGASGIILFNDESVMHQAFLTFVLGGMTIGAAVAYAVLLRAYVAYMATSMVPLIGRFLSEGDEIHLAMGGMCILFLILVTIIAVRINRMTISSMRLRFEREDFISYLSSANEEQERLNKTLVGEISERAKVEEELEQHKMHLETLVKERTEELFSTNIELQHEIAMRKEVEDQFQDLHKGLLTILDGVDSLIYLADMKTYELLFINKYGRDIWGDIQGETCWQSLQDGMESPCDFCTNKYLLNEEGQPAEPYKWESQNTVNGHWYFIIDRAVKWIDGRLVRLEIATDITDRKTVEEERQRSHKLESIGILAGGIAHDFNNLLTAVANNIFLARNSIDPEDNAYNKLELAENAIGRATTLTQQLLTFSKGGAPLKQSTSISEVIKESSEFSLRGSNVICEYEFPGDLWPVEVDTGQMSQVFQNLIINADQSMPAGGTIRISGKNEVVNETSELPFEPGKYVIISVRDEGVGISKEHLNNIFDPYYTSKEMGRGLGLTIVFSIIRNHNGYIKVQSEVGLGTTFILYLPVSENKPLEKETVEDASSAGKKKILIMDDEDMIRDSLGEMLTATGFTVELANDGREAMEIYNAALNSSEPFDAVILDLTVPGGMGGRETITKLQEIDRSVKAIISSGYSNDEVIANYMDYGFSGVITKPYTPAKVISILNSILS